MATKLPVPMKKPRRWPFVVVAVAIMIGVLLLQAIMANQLTGGGAPARTYAYYDLEMSRHPELSNSQGYAVEPEDGREFIIATICVRNNQEGEISSNAYMWEYSIDGVRYMASSYTFLGGIVNYSLVSIGNGGEFTFQTVYEVPAGQPFGSLIYTGPYSDALVRDASLLP